MATISQPIFLKRTNKELENFNDKKYIPIASDELKKLFDKITIDIISVPKHDTIGNNYFLKILKDNKFYLELSIPSYYPFKPYEIIDFRLCSSINYSRYMNNLYEGIKFKNKDAFIFFFKNQYQMEPTFLCLNETACYCCSSITCPNNWSPSSRIDHVILEYLELEFIQKYSSRLGYRYLTNIYDNLFKNDYFAKLPDEVIKIILKNI